MYPACVVLAPHTSSPYYRDCQEHIVATVILATTVYHLCIFGLLIFVFRQAEVGTLRAELEVQRRAAQQAEQARRIASAAAESAHAELQTLRAELEQFQRKVGLLGWAQITGRAAATCVAL
jgi:hypothetical protein